MAIEPITRKEKFLAKAGGQQVSVPEPITREEMFLSNICGGSSSGGEKKIILYGVPTGGSSLNVTPNVTFEEALEMLTNFNFAGIYWAIDTGREYLSVNEASEYGIYFFSPSSGTSIYWSPEGEFDISFS